METVKSVDSAASKRRRIREIKPIRQPTFAERLEERAIELMRQRQDAPDVHDRAAKREVALALSHLHRLRATDRFVTRSLMRHECYLGTAIIQREPRPPVYQDPRLPERDRLRDRLREIDAERRRWRISYAMQMQSLVDRLATVITRHEQQSLND